MEDQTTPATDATTAEPCKCIDLTNEALKKHNTELDRDWQINRTTGGALDTVSLGTHLIEKKRGARPVVILPVFCPFCGQRYATPCTQP